MELVDAYTVPGAAAGAVALTQFVKLLWNSASATQLRTISAALGLGIVSAIQWDTLTGSVEAGIGVALAGVTAGLAASGSFDAAKAAIASVAAKATNGAAK